MSISVERGATGSRQFANATLISAEQGTPDGTWIDVRGLTYFSFHSAGINGETVQVQASNAPTIPANSADGAVMASITTNTVTLLTGPFRWLKAEVTSGGSGTVYLYMEAASGGN